jgi:hypothetical protein
LGGLELDFGTLRLYITRTHALIYDDPMIIVIMIIIIIILQCNRKVITTIKIIQ